MIEVSPLAFMGLAGVLFTLGLYGAVSRKGVVMVLMSFQLMVAAVTLNFAALSRAATPAEMTGEVFAMVLMAVSAAQIGLALALALAIRRRRSATAGPVAEEEER